MMSDKFTQGTIIEYVRSTKYPNIKCVGLVISARCDLAQEKISQFHCLSAMNIEEWIYEVLFENVANERKNNILGEIKKYCVRKNLDYSTLCGMSVDNANQILMKSASPKEQKNIQKIIDDRNDIEKLLKTKMEKKEKEVFLSRNKKIVVSKLKALYNSSLTRFAFVPEKAYSGGTSNVKGVVVDLQDVIQLDIKVKEPLLAYEFDYILQKEQGMREYINRYFFFESESDFVIAENVVTSPWIEYVLQRFANSFIRIGVDNALEYEIEDYCTEIFKGDNK
ncbi:MAG: hypothetical protein NC124_18725 [Clostridium sp.]|nr:hypothetical protein [Clostridium sp.]